MDTLFRKSDRLLANTQAEIIRDKMDEIHWNTQLVSIMGAKGVGKSTFEIGGRSKGFSQMAGVKDSYIFADDWDMPDGAKLPLWMLGFLY